MRIKYLGPGEKVNVAPYGEHFKDEIKKYPDEFGAELIETSEKQRFEAVDGGVITKTDKPIKDMTVAELTGLLKKMTVEIPENAKKAALVELVKKNTAEPKTED